MWVKFTPAVCKYVTCGGDGLAKFKATPTYVEPRSRRLPSNLVFKLTMLTVETLSCFALKTV